MGVYVAVISPRRKYQLHCIKSTISRAEVNGWTIRKVNFENDHFSHNWNVTLFPAKKSEDCWIKSKYINIEPVLKIQERKENGIFKDCFWVSIHFTTVSKCVVSG
ncbi:Hypothetical predicted protein [Octopus vulgaris]|uniref:Uncharacterized protein n=1 Tax=Octopus vulgaris TaxID=6645 RepID=A0AA36B133_OCTVU|nr:Hypothetical predicted protein [Octopus vulgaris]